MRRIVYLIEQPLDARNYERFGIQAWIDRGWHVEVWDLTPLSHPRVWREHQKQTGGSGEFAQHFPIASHRDLKQRCAVSADISYFIDLTGDTYDSWQARARLARAGAARVVCCFGAIPLAGNGRQSALGAKLHKARAIGLARSLHILVDPLLRRLTQLPVQPSLAIVAGESSLPAAAHATVAGVRVIAAHNLDYDVYLSLGASDGGGAAPIAADPYIVFLDQDYCFHVEYLYQGVTTTLAPARYFPVLCRGLRQIAGALGAGVRVAAHPRSNYRQRAPDYFEGIPVESGNTAQLVRGCKAVVCHDSTAVQLAVLFGKPVIFVTTDDLDRLYLDSSFKRESIGAFAAELGKSVINLDRDLENVDWREQLKIDARRYADYRHSYIKMAGTPEIPYWNIVIDHIEGKPAALSGTRGGCR